MASRWFWLLVRALSINVAFAATLKWSGMRVPSKVSAGDGVTNLGMKIGKFLALHPEESAHAIFVAPIGANLSASPAIVAVENHRLHEPRPATPCALRGGCRSYSGFTASAAAGASTTVRTLLRMTGAFGFGTSMTPR